MKSIRRTFSVIIIFLAALALIFQPARAQSDAPLVIVMTADGPIMPPMLEYIKRGIETAERRNAEVLIIELNTPGGSPAFSIHSARMYASSGVSGEGLETMVQPAARPAATL